MSHYPRGLGSDSRIRTRSGLEACDYSEAPPLCRRADPVRPCGPCGERTPAPLAAIETGRIKTNTKAWPNHVFRRLCVRWSGPPCLLGLTGAEATSSLPEAVQTTTRIGAKSFAAPPPVPRTKKRRHYTQRERPSAQGKLQFACEQCLVGETQPQTICGAHASTRAGKCSIQSGGLPRCAPPVTRGQALPASPTTPSPTLEVGKPKRGKKYPQKALRWLRDGSESIPHPQPSHKSVAHSHLTAKHRSLGLC